MQDIFLNWKDPGGQPPKGLKEGEKRVFIDGYLRKEREIVFKALSLLSPLKRFFRWKGKSTGCKGCCFCL